MASEKKPKKRVAKKAAAKKSTTKAKNVTPEKNVAETAAPEKRRKRNTPPLKTSEDSKIKEPLKEIANKRDKHTPAVFKLPNRRHTPVVFSLEEVREVIKTRKKEEAKAEKPATKKAKPAAKKKVAEPVVVEEPQDSGPRVLGAASLADILGFNPAAPQRPDQSEASQVPKKWKLYYDLLLDLRKHVREELDEHASETLKRSTKDDAGDLSNYSQHMADAGSDNYDRDFALSMLSTEQEALKEIEDAIKRIKDGSYGVCEITGKPIAKERLEAVPFTRFSIEGQAEYEAQQSQEDQPRWWRLYRFQRRFRRRYVR